MDKTWRLILLTVATYYAVLFVLRLAGKRIFSEDSPLTFIVSIVIGTLVANMISKTPLSWTDGLIVVTTLVFLAVLTSQVEVYAPWLANSVEGQPTLLYYNRRFDYDQMKKERVSEKNIYQSLRLHGFAEPEQVKAVVLEVNGKLSVIE